MRELLSFLKPALFSFRLRFEDGELLFQGFIVVYCCNFFSVFSFVFIFLSCLLCSERVMRILVFALEKNPLSLGTSVLVDTEFRLGQLAQK